MSTGACFNTQKGWHGLAVVSGAVGSKDVTGDTSRSMGVREGKTVLVLVV